MEGVFGVERQTRNLGGLDALVLRNDARFCAIAVETQTAQVRRRKIDLIPFEDNGCLGGIPAAEDGCSRRGDAIGAEDGGLEGGEGFLRG